MDTAKLEKIQKCLRLSKSANENEAATALRHAVALMNQLGIDEKDLEGLGYGNTEVEVPLQAGKKVPMQLSALVNLICKAFGVECAIERNLRISDLSWRIRYFGIKNRLPTAGYAHVVIYRAMEAAWSAYLALNSHLKGQRNVKASFQIGWIAGVRAKVEEIGFTEQEEAIIKDAMIKHYGKELTTSKSNKSYYGSIANDGKNASGSFNINRPMDGKSQLAIGA